MHVVAFIDQLKGLASKHQVAPIQFEEHSDLGEVSKYFTEIAVTEHEGKNLTDDETIEEVVKTIDEAKDTDEGKALYLNLDKIAAQITHAYMENKQYLSIIIGNKVTELTDKVIKERNKVICEAGLEALFDIDDSEEMEEFKWDGIDVLGGEEVVQDNVRAMTNLSLPDVSKTGVTYGAAKLDVSYGDIEPLIDPNGIVESISEIIQADKEIAGKYLSLILNGYKADQFIKGFMASILSKEANFSLLVKESNKLITEFYPVLKVVESLPLTLDDKSKEFMSNNIKSLNKFLMVVGYFMLYSRDVYFRDALIMDKDTLNTDEMEDFSDAGIGFDTIKTHIAVNYLYPGHPVPLRGITLKEVVKSKEGDTVKLETIKATSESMRRDVLIDSTTKAFFRVVGSDKSMDSVWYNPKLESPTMFESRKHGSIKKAVNYLSGEDNCVEDALYQYLIMMDPKKHVLGNLYEAFGKELETRANESLSIDEDLIIDTERTILSNAILNAINHVFVVK